MQKKAISIIAGIIAAVIIATVVSFYVAQKPDDEIKTQWIVSGPFAISKPQYKIGESVFMTVNGLRLNEVGNILVVDPHGKIYRTIPFNGTAKDHFNHYFKPDTGRVSELYTPQDLVGTWYVVFQGAQYNPLSFEIVNEFLPGAETDVVTVQRPAANSTG